LVRPFAQASRPGAYLRIVQEGALGAGDGIGITHRPDNGVSVRLVSLALMFDHRLIPQVLQAPMRSSAETAIWAATGHG